MSSHFAVCAKSHTDWVQGGVYLAGLASPAGGVLVTYFSPKKLGDSEYKRFQKSRYPEARMPGIPENPRLTNRGSGNARICSICSILVVLLAINEYGVVNASGPEMPSGRVRIMWYLRYLSSGTLKNTSVFEGPGAQVR